VGRRHLSADQTGAVDVHESIRRRRMVRAFEPRPIDDAVLDRVLDAGRRVPSAGNTQAVDLLVIDDPERYWSITFHDPAARARFRWQGLFDAPILVIPVVDPAAYARRYAEPDKASTGLGAGTGAWSVPYWWVDGGMAVQNLLLAVTAEGLGALFFGIFEHEPAVKHHFGIPEGHRVVGVVALGHPTERQEPGASAARPRRPLEETVHRGRW
jgi:nitroreductase